MSNKTGAGVPEEVTLIMGFIDARIAEIESRERITPWNKAKLMAFKEVREVVAPPAPAVPQAADPFQEPVEETQEVVPTAPEEAPVETPETEATDEPTVRYEVVEDDLEPIF